MRHSLAFAVLLCLLAGPAASRAASQNGAAALADELLAADRGFAAAAADRTLIDALTAMFRDDVTMSHPKGFARSAAEAKAILESNPANATSRVEWWPVRAGISADGLHGFTFGLMRIARADGSTAPAKYMSYWIKEGGAWRVAAYKRAGGGSGEKPRELMAASLPAAMVTPTTDAAQIAAHVDSLRKAEQAFSDEAQTIGIGPAFTKWGRADAVNMGSPQNPGFTVSADAIGGGFGPNATGDPGIEWNADFALVASSGDLGVTFGYIRPKDGSNPPVPFFTIWRRDSPSSPWRYIAE